MKLKCVNKKVANEKMQFPIIGHVKFDENSTIEVADELVESFLKVKCGYDFVEIGKDGKVAVVEVVLTAEQEELESKQEAYKAGLNNLAIEEINALIATNPIEETQGLRRKTEKVNYLLGKQFPVTE